MKIGDARVHPGGLMRCCLATLEKRKDEEVPWDRELPCNYEDSLEAKMFLDVDDVWRWVGLKV